MLSFKVFYGLMVLLISIGAVSAQEIITIQTDSNHYDEGDTIVVSGNVNTVIGKTPQVILQVLNEGNVVEIAQITVSQDGSFVETFLAVGERWKKAGEYTVRASYQKYQTETSFQHTPKSAVVDVTERFVVDAGSSGNFDVNYTIRGATVRDMVIDFENLALVVRIDSTDDGRITMELPRDYMGAESQDGRDETFIVRIDQSIDASPIEVAVHDAHRVITIDFEQGDSEIAVIGTYIVPEFGTVAMAVLMVGIITVILVSRNRFYINA